MKSTKEELKNLPGIDKILCLSEVKDLIDKYNKDLVTYSIRNVIDNYRKKILAGNYPPSKEEILQKIKDFTQKTGNRNLKPVINASGIIIHTNLGRAPFGKELVNEVSNIINVYNNLEFDLKTGKRGQRNDHASELLKFLTGAEDILIVNNNAAAVMLILRTFAKDKEVVVSRGELIEIGGSFRIPDIMAASDCKMLEVGTTNKTNIEDYENAISEKTAMLFKAHKSNYVIKGFTKEVKLTELVELGKKNNVPVIYDIGSGLLRKVDNKVLKNEPDVKQALSTGIDLICFSGDKLLGGPQAGIIAGKKKMIDVLKKEPMMRALRVCKTTLAFLETACIYYLNDKDLFEKNLIFKTLSWTEDELNKTAHLLQKELKKSNYIESAIIGEVIEQQNKSVLIS